MTENAASQLELYWVHGNHLGVAIVTTDAQGSIVDPGSNFLRPGFPGQSQVLSDLYYNRNRDPVTGRYIQADPIGLWGDVNPYVYAGADPVNGIDPDGLFWREVGGAALGAAANLTWQLYNSGGRFNCVDWWQVGEWALAGTGLGALVPNGLRLGGRRAIREIWKDTSGAAGRGSRIPNGNLKAPPKKRGCAPKGDDDHPVELHHDGQKSDSPLKEMTRTNHRGKGNFKKITPTQVRKNQTSIGKNGSKSVRNIGKMNGIVVDLMRNKLS